MTERRTLGRMLDTLLGLAGLCAAAGAFLAWYTSDGAKLSLEGTARALAGGAVVVGGVLAGLLRIQLTRAAVGRLVIQLGQQRSPDRLRDCARARTARSGP